MGVLVGLWNGTWVARLGVPAFVATFWVACWHSAGHRWRFPGSNHLRHTRRDPLFWEAFITGPALWAFLAWPPPWRFCRCGISAIHRGRSTPGERLRRVAGVLILGWTTLSYRGLPMPVAITLVIPAMIMSWSLRNLVWGRHAYAIGGNRDAARVAGINVGRQIIIGYVIIGVLTAVGAVLFVGRLGAAPPETGYFLELSAISAVVIGGPASMAAAAPYQAFSWARC